MPTFQLPVRFRPDFRTLLKRITTVAPRDPKLTVGLDIGSTSVKVVALGQGRGSRKRSILGQNLASLSGTPGTDATEAVRSAVSTLQLPIRSVNLSVSGQWVIMRVVEMPPMKPAELKQALPFEAQRYLPFNIDEVVLDGVALGPAEGNKSWVLIVACKKDLIERRLDWVKRAGLEPALIDVDALALANAYLEGGSDGVPEDGRRALLDVGGQLSNLVVFKGRVPYLVRDIPWGGDKMVRHVADQLGADVDTVAQQLAQGAVSPEVQNATRLTCEGLVAELQLSFDYFENRFGQPPEAVLVSGGLSQSTAFLEALRSHLPQNVSPWSPTGGLSGQFAVAYGLALRTD